MCMCFGIKPIPKETLDNMEKFKYSYSDDSYLYNYCMSPCLNKLVNYLPKTLAPNLITFFSLMCNVVAFLVSINDNGFDFDQPLKKSTCYIIGFSQILYQLLDSVDGKQARRTGNSTPFGMIMDHGCDIFTNIFTSFNVSKLLIVGNEGFFSFSVFLGLMMGFYMMTYEDYKIGEMHFPVVNGADEGNFSVFLIGVWCGLFGQGWLESSIFGLRVGKFIGGMITLGGLSALYNLYLHTYQKKGTDENIRNIIDNLTFYCAIFVPIFYIYFKSDFYLISKWVVILNSCLLFARVTLETQIKIATMDTFKCNCMLIYSSLLFILSLFISSFFINLGFLVFLALSQILEITVLIYIRANEIANYLEINIFSIEYHGVA